MNAADSLHALVAGFATKVRPEPCRCDRLGFPHRRDYECDDHAELTQAEADADRRQQAAEWAADRAQDARAINRENT